MTLEITPIQPAQETGPFSTPSSDDTIAAPPRRPPPRSRLTYCIAWLFGIDALLLEPPEHEDLHV